MNINSLNNNIGEIVKDSVGSKTVSTPSGGGFADLLKKELDQTNHIQETAEKASVDIATGTVKDLHKANIAIEKAEMNMKLMLEVRNKALSAYKELIKTQI
jgi:flagellar hook-basal body complex protein FliE